MKYTVLYIGPDINLCKYIDESLSGPTFEIFHAATIPVSMNIILQQSPSIVLIDENIYGSDPYKLAEIIKRQHNLAHIGVIAIVSKQFIFDQTYALSTGLDDFIEKPFRPDELFEKAISLANKLSILRSTENPDISRKQVDPSGPNVNSIYKQPSHIDQVTRKSVNISISERKPFQPNSRNPIFLTYQEPGYVKQPKADASQNNIFYHGVPDPTNKTPSTSASSQKKIDQSPEFLQKFQGSGVSKEADESSEPYHDPIDDFLTDSANPATAKFSSPNIQDPLIHKAVNSTSADIPDITRMALAEIQQKLAPFTPEKIEGIITKILDAKVNEFIQGSLNIDTLAELIKTEIKRLLPRLVDEIKRTIKSS